MRGKFSDRNVALQKTVFDLTEKYWSESWLTILIHNIYPLSNTNDKPDSLVRFVANSERIYSRIPSRNYKTIYIEQQILQAE